MFNEDYLDLRKIKAISDYQFGPDITDILFNKPEHIRIERSRNTNKIRYVYFKDTMLLSLRPTNGFFTLTNYSAKKILEKTSIPRLRVVVLTEISEFIIKGRNVFCKHVVDIDSNLRPMDEVIVVNQEDKALAIGRLKIPAYQVKFFESGIAVDVRKGILNN
ncbi:MAG: PUA domain-containing protein [Promethearchaeota archaeon]